MNVIQSNNSMRAKGLRPIDIAALLPLMVALGTPSPGRTTPRPEAPKPVPSRAVELEYKGKTYRAWVEELKPRPGDPRLRVCWELSQDGVAVLPLVKYLLAHSDAEIRDQGISIAHSLGPKARPVLPALQRALNDPDRKVRYWAGKAILATRPSLAIGMEALLVMLQDDLTDKTRFRGAAGDALDALGPVVVEELGKLLRNKDRETRVLAAHGLGRLGQDSKAALPALLDALGDDNVSQTVAETLERIGTDCIPGLRRALKDSRPTARRTAARTLWQIVRDVRGPALDKEAILQDLSETCRTDPDPEVRLQATESLWEMGRQTTVVLPTLLELAEHKDPSVRRQSLYLMRDLSEKARAALPVLIKSLADPDAGVRLQATDTLPFIGDGAEEGVPALIRALRDESAAVGVGAATALARIGPKATEALPALRKVVRDGSGGARVAAANAVGRITGGGDEVMPVLLEAIKDPTTCSAAADVLAWSIPPKGKAAMRVLIECLEGENRDVQVAAIRVLASIGPEARPALPALLKLLRHDAPWPRDWITRIIKDIDPSAVPPAGQE